MKKILAGMMIVGMLGACATDPPKEQEPARVEDAGAATPPPPPPSGPRVATPADRGKVGMDPLKDPGSILSKRSIYFDFDSNVVKDEFRPVVEANAKVLTTQPARKMAVQGHTDDRGSSEYNLALGQRRAEAVVKSLTLMGVKPSQLEATSFGKERPAVQGENEEAWAKNRRAELMAAQ